MQGETRQRIGRYELVAPLDAGGMGQIVGFGLARRSLQQHQAKPARTPSPAAASAIPLTAADDIAPNIELRGPKGQRQRLADFRGKIVLLEIWASWRPDCKVLFPALDTLSREFTSRGVEVIAVNVDEHREDADAFLRTQQYQLRVMFDQRARVVAAFRGRGVPASFLIDGRGTIRYAHEGWDSTADTEYRREILELLDERAGSVRKR